jgi:hypothetical protein
MESLYTIIVSKPEYIDFINDLVRMIIIQVMIQFLFYLNNPSLGFFTGDFFLLIIYICLGVCVYWLIFKKLINFAVNQEQINVKMV